MPQHIRLVSLPTRIAVSGKEFEIGIWSTSFGNAPAYCIAALHGKDEPVILSEMYSDRGALTQAATTRFEQRVAADTSSIVAALMAGNKAFNV